MAIELTFDTLLSVSSCLSPRALLSLARTSRTLTEPLAKAAVRAALMVRSNQVPKPIAHAIEHGDLPLLSLSLATLDTLYSQGWRWPGLYTGVSEEFSP
ncbi:hypothetical protein F5B22DRAFT_590058 [Xylaria bambusicola]|uniref:uncharacterized protein n=1 Tax=Xylaria bambusicola TaxID=326684 RepID=UPI00200794BA|nr:uncharacterized protein F5B22DRAFT_590058 [Xylaria bambusicola]KAI0525464.1 hypothetical protein F5B22DRAFT_590058 [Xylaria bambusicola]